jgi:hypothetical protein
MKTMLAAIGLACLGGCASIAGEKTQPLTVQTVLEAQEMAGVGCTLANDAGKWFVTSPGTVVVHKSTGDLSIDCAKETFIAGHETLISKSNGAVWGNVLVGGGIGYIIDRNTGAGFDYPSNVTVTLRRIGEPAASAPAAAAASSPGVSASAPLALLSASQAAR